MHLSVIIPAHNEETVIARLLSAILAGDCSQIQVVVVCNGCSDRTAEVSRGAGQGVEVIETEIASKVRALNVGDRAAKWFPRIYVDADVVIDHRSLCRVAEALSEPGVLAAAPVPALDLASCSRAVRRFYAVDERMPSHQGGIGGSGVYALSKAGRARFEEFPDVTGDDAFVRRHFAAGERVVVADARSQVTPPSRLGGLIGIKTRSHFGNMELSTRFPQLASAHPGGNSAKLLRLSARPWWWLSVGTYVFVKLAARLRARMQLARGRRGTPRSWERDETSRRAKPVSA